MSEINGPKFSVSNLSFNSVQKQTPDSFSGSNDDEEPKIKDFGNVLTYLMSNNLDISKIICIFAMKTQILAIDST